MKTSCRRSWAVRPLAIFCLIIVAGCSSRPAPEELAKQIVVSDIVLENYTLPANGNPGQIVKFKITNNSSFAVNDVRATYVFDIDGSGLLEKGSQKIVPAYCICADELQPGEFVQKEGLILIQQTDGRASAVRVVPVSATWVDP